MQNGKHTQIMDLLWLKWLEKQRSKLCHQKSYCITTSNLTDPQFSTDRHFCVWVSVKMLLWNGGWKNWQSYGESKVVINLVPITRICNNNLINNSNKLITIIQTWTPEIRCIISFSTSNHGKFGWSCWKGYRPFLWRIRDLVMEVTMCCKPTILVYVGIWA